MRGHNISFVEKYEKLSLNYPQYPSYLEQMEEGFNAISRIIFILVHTVNSIS